MKIIPTVWRATPVDLVPELVLSGWSFFRTERGEIHLAGYNETELEGRVSSRLLSYDRATRVATSRSGRRYRLVGRPGLGLDAQYVLNRWLEINRVTAWDDVTGIVEERGIVDAAAADDGIK